MRSETRGHERRLHEGLCYLWDGARVSDSSVRKFMYVTACCMSCMHHVGASWGTIRGTCGADIQFSAY
jgi:hypothetical protein